MSTPPPARCHIGAEWNDGQGAGLHLSGLNRTASPASYPQHGFVFQPIGCPFRVMRVRIPSKHDGPSGHMRKNWVPEWEQSVADGMNRPQDKHPCLAWPIRRSSCRNGSAVVAQLAEQRPRNAQVTGPNPVDGSFSTKNRPVFPPLFGWFFGKPATGQAWRIPVPLP